MIKCLAKCESILNLYEPEIKINNIYHLYFSRRSISNEILFHAFTENPHFVSRIYNCENIKKFINLWEIFDMDCSQDRVDKLEIDMIRELRNKKIENIFI